MKPIDYAALQWYCVHTKPSHEAAVAESLRRLAPGVRENVGEIEVYFPRIRAKMPVGGALRMVSRPLFPRYLFARFALPQAGRFVASRLNVLRLVQFGEHPAVVPAEMVEELRSLGDAGDAEVLDPTLDLRPGQRVVIQGGPFKGMEAELVCHLSDSKRVSLLLDHLQIQASMIVDRSLLKPVY